MPTSVLTRGRKIVARLTALAMVASIMVIGALPASAAIDTSATCPASTPSAGFTDIAGLPASTQLAINCIADYEISQGTSATTFSPAMEVSRWQMALFLTRQAEVHGLTLGDGSDQGFTDIGAYPATTQVAINQLAQLDITQGTTATTFSPAEPVSRWQMALFLTRLLTKAGVTLGDGSDQGFTDIGDYPASTQVAINQIAQAEVSEGFSATTFGPGQPTLRSQMALFLTRTLAADGIIPTGTYFYVTAIDVANNKLTYSNGTATATFEWVDTDAKTRNGAAVSNAVYEATVGTFDGTATAGAADGVTALQVDPVTGDIKTGVDDTSGLVGAVAATEVHIVEPVTGIAIGDIYHGGATDFDFFTVDGAAATEAGYNAAISVGDMVAVTGGDGTTSAKARTIAVTNGTASGTVTADGVGTFTIGVLVVPDPVDADSKTVDGANEPLAADFLAALTVGDSATYARAGGAQTYTLTNNAPSAVTGVAVANKVALVDTVALGDDTDETVDVVVGNGPATTVTLRDSGAEDMVDATESFASYKVDGAIVTAAEFFAAITVGDIIVTQAADAETSTTSSISLTNVAGIAGVEVTSIDGVGDTLTIELGDGNDDSEDISYVATSVAGLSVGTGGVVKYQVDGVAATVGDWEADVAAFIAAPSITPEVTLTKVGVDLVWNVTS